MRELDAGDADRNPVLKPDNRSRLRRLGPAAIFCAKNFPLAFSVAGEARFRPWLWEPRDGSARISRTRSPRNLREVRSVMLRLKPDAGWGVLAAIQRPATTLAGGWLITWEFTGQPIPFFEDE